MEMRGRKTKKDRTTVCRLLWALSLGQEVCLSVCRDCEEQHLCVCNLERKKEADHYWEFYFSSIALFSKSAIITAV